MTSKLYQLSVESTVFRRLLKLLEKNGTSLTIIMHRANLLLHVSPGTLQENKPISINSRWSYRPRTEMRNILSLANGISRTLRRLLLRSKLTCLGSSAKLVLLELPSMQTKSFNSLEQLESWNGETSPSVRSILWDLTNSQPALKDSLRRGMQSSRTKGTKSTSSIKEKSDESNS